MNEIGDGRPNTRYGVEDCTHDATCRTMSSSVFADYLNIFTHTRELGSSYFNDRARASRVYRNSAAPSTLNKSSCFNREKSLCTIAKFHWAVKRFIYLAITTVGH